MNKKIINRPEEGVSETISGYLESFPEFKRVPDTDGICKKNQPEKVAIVIGGGSGHEPMFAFFVGEGLADASVAGQVFTSPGPQAIMNAALAAETGQGVLFLYGNYAGDNMNFDIAAELLEDMGIQVKTVRVMDDIASAPIQRKEDRRGIAGTVFVIKIAGAAAECGLNLDEVAQIATQACDHVFTMGVSLDGVSIPGEEKPIFSLEEDELEFGVGIHGEAGIQRGKMLTANELTDTLYQRLKVEASLQPGNEVCTLVNGLGSATLMEKLIVNQRLAQRLKEDKIKIHRMEVGDYVTSLDMKGISISLLKLDHTLRQYYDMPCSAPFYKR